MNDRLAHARLSQVYHSHSSNILSAVLVLKSQNGVQKNFIGKMHWLRREFNIDPDNEDIISQNLHNSFDSNKVEYVRQYGLLRM